MTSCIGLMSGTSLDGVDGVLVQWGGDSGSTMRIVCHSHEPLAPELRQELLALQQPGNNEWHRAALAGNGVARAYAAVVLKLLSQGHTRSQDVSALGAHGQTIRHRPGEFDGAGYTSQILNGALLAELTGIDVVCDFRSRDVAAGGQGAPLVPAFHAAAFGQVGQAHAVLNIGGMANITLLHADGTVTGFDTGPGGALLDGWCQRHHNTAYDAAGTWAQTGRVDAALLADLLAEPFFARTPPKSTGRDTFNMAWVDAAVAQHKADSRPADVQATLSELTAVSVVQALKAHALGTHELIVCGGGARNSDLLARMARLMPQARMRSSDTEGILVDQVEAAAFAWLARQFMLRQPGNLPAVTAAQGPRVLGALYPAR